MKKYTGLFLANRFPSFLESLKEARKSFYNKSAFLPRQINVQKYINQDGEISWHTEFKGIVILFNNKCPVFCRHEDASDIYRNKMPDLRQEEVYFEDEEAWERLCIKMYDEVHPTIEIDDRK